jgi:hypothetical protein
METSEKRPGRTKNKVIAVLVLLVAGLLALVISMMLDRREAEEKHKAEIRNEIDHYVRVKLNDYTVNALGGLSNIRATVENASSFTIDRVDVEIYYYKAVGDIFQTEVISFTDVPPHSTQWKSAPDSDRGTEVKHRITAVHSAELGL